MQITRRSSIKTMAAGAAAIALFHSEWRAAATQSKPVIRIAFNENPDGPSPAARAAIGSPTLTAVLVCQARIWLSLHRSSNFRAKTTASE